jgi:hypothetical protein
MVVGQIIQHMDHVQQRRCYLTPVTKVFRQNVRSFSGDLKATNASQKQLVRLRIFCVFLFESSEEIFERCKKVVWTGKFFVLKVENFVDRSTSRAKFTLPKRTI